VKLKRNDITAFKDVRVLILVEREVIWIYALGVRRGERCVGPIV
jgi:hypothetical protein